jgi:hypothetical protein
MAETTQERLDAAEDALLQEVSAERLMDYDTNVSQWVRLSGTEDERKAFDYIERTLRDWGLAIEQYSPTCLVSLPGPATLTLVDSGEQPYCITHSFSTSTGSAGMEAELVYVGGGSEADYQGKDVRGKIVLTDGLAGPAKVRPSENHSAAGMVNISGPQIHEMIISPVWGSPTPDTIDLLPTIPHVSVNSETGDMLKERLARGPVRVRLTTEVDTGWRPLPVLVGTITPTRQTDEYVLFSGHVDSWHYGAMDNGSANATMMEVARILQAHRDLLRRGVRFAFWSGHSHARYGTSAWFADEFWHDLSEHCVGHVNIDGPGAVNATVLTNAPTMAEAYGLARDVIERLTDQELEYRRIGRLGDQSFWGVGIPSFYCGISSQGPSEQSSAVDTGRALGGGRGRSSGGTAWWWHTPDDTLDKIDPQNLARDAKVLVATVYHLATDRVLPYDQSAAVEEIRQALDEISSAAGDAFDLSAVRADADALLDATKKLNERRAQPVSDEQAQILNRCIVQLSRLLIPVNYTQTGRFDQDLALQFQPVPGLRAAAQLRNLPGDSQERHTLEVKLRRERNRVRHALREGRAAIEQALAETR